MEGSRPARGEWIEIYARRMPVLMIASRPARGEWIEMREYICAIVTADVSPREGRVD